MVVYEQAMILQMNCKTKFQLNNIFFRIREARNMTLEELKRIKQSLGYTNQDVADKSGVPLGTVQKIFAGITTAPRTNTLLAIEKALRSSYMSSPEKTYDIVSDVTLAYLAKTNQKGEYDRQGQYTLDDYYALPDDKRVELIDGVIYDMTAPTINHQSIALDIAMQLAPCVEKHENCRVLISPVDVQLDCDNRTMVEPDVVILCDPSKNINRCIYGAPDLVMEVLSPSMRKKDMILKLQKYFNAGCKEYWIIDPKNERVTVYIFDDDDITYLYTFNDKVPVGISNGECEVDFSKIKDRLNWGAGQ